MQESEVRVILLAQDAAEFRDVATGMGLETRELTSRFADPLTVMLIIAGSAIAVAQFQALAERRKGGQVFDMRSGAPAPFYRSKDLHYGLIAVLSDAGLVQVEVLEPDDMFVKTVESLTKLVIAWRSLGLDEIESKAQEALGSAATVSSSPFGEIEKKSR